MENNENETLSRASRHELNNKKKPSNKGKNIFTLVSIALVALVGFGGYTIYEIKHEEALAKEAFEKGAKTLLAEVQEERDQSGLPSTKQEKDQDFVKTVVYLPSNKEEQVPIENVDKDLENLAAKMKKNVKKEERAVVVSKLDLKHLTEKLDAYQMTADHYKWDPEKESFTQEKSLTEDPIYIAHATGKPVTSKDLVKSEADLLGIQQVIQQKILDQAKDKNAIIDKVLNMPRVSFKDKIEYAPDSLTFELPKNDTDTDKITLDYKDIAAYIDSSLVDPATIKDAFPTLEAGKKYVALTFDDGPNPTTTPKILDILKAKKASATFFMLGENVAANKDLVKRVLDEGNEIASHSFSHPVLPSLSDEQVKSEILKTDKAIFEACGVLPRNIRPPYGAADERVARLTGKPIINWNVDSEDWKSKNAGAINKQIKDNLYEGTIVLMHDIQPATVQALPGVIDNMRKEGYEFVSVDKMLKGQQKPMYVYFGATDFRLAKDL